MSHRARSVASNEAVCRTANAAIENFRGRFGDISETTLDIVCECGDLLCFEGLAVPLVDY